MIPASSANLSYQVIARNQLDRMPITPISAFDLSEPEQALDMLTTLLRNSIGAVSFFGERTIGTIQMQLYYIPVHPPGNFHLEAPSDHLYLKLSLIEVAKTIVSIYETLPINTSWQNRIKISICAAEILSLLEQTEEKIKKTNRMVRWFLWLLAWFRQFPTSIRDALQYIITTPLILTEKEIDLLCASTHGEDRVASCRECRPDEHKVEFDFRITPSYSLLAAREGQRAAVLYSWQGIYYATLPRNQRRPSQLGVIEVHDSPLKPKESISTTPIQVDYSRFRIKPEEFMSTSPIHVDDNPTPVSKEHLSERKLAQRKELWLTVQSIRSL